MWRKPEESLKVTSPTPEGRETSKPVTPVQTVQPAAPPRPVQAAMVSEATSPASHITSTLRIKGDITGRDDLFIDGELEGTIRLEEGRVTIGPKGRVTADVEAREIVVRGQSPRAR